MRLHAFIIERRGGSSLRDGGVFFDFCRSVEILTRQIASSGKRTLVAHLYEQRSYAALSRVKDRSSAANQQEHILQEIIRFFVVLKNSSRNRPDQTCVAVEQETEYVGIVGVNLGN